MVRKDTYVLYENIYAFYIDWFAHQLQLAVVFVAKWYAFVEDFFNNDTLLVNMVFASCKINDQLLQDCNNKIVDRLESSVTFKTQDK